MNKTVKCVAVSVALSSLSAMAQPTVVPIKVGGQTVLEVKGIQRVAIGDTEIADVRPIGNAQLLVSGIDVGSTTLLVWTELHGKANRLEYEVKVAADPMRPPDGPSRSAGLNVGEMRALDFKEIEHVSVGDPELVDVRVQANELLLTGIAPGTTSVLVWDKAGKRHRVSVAVTGTRRVESSDSAIGEAWTLEVGAAQVVPLPARVGVSDWEVCHLEDTAKGVVLRGHSPGTAEIMVTTPDNKRTRHALTVTAAPPRK